MPEFEQKILKKSQIQWIKSKDPCNQYYDEIKYGHEGRFSVVVCRTKKTDGRIQYLTSYKNCYQKDSQSLNFQNCMQDEYHQLDKKLNIVYSTLISKSSVENQKELKTDEVSWIKYKEKTCNPYKKSGANNLAFIECQIEQTQEQVLVLKSQLAE